MLTQLIYFNILHRFLVSAHSKLDVGILLHLLPFICKILQTNQATSLINANQEHAEQTLKVMNQRMRYLTRKDRWRLIDLISLQDSALCCVRIFSISVQVTWNLSRIAGPSPGLPLKVAKLNSLTCASLMVSYLGGSGKLDIACMRCMCTLRGKNLLCEGKSLLRRKYVSVE